jgi:colanic acid/amylovoran biosynthesis protein
VKVLVLGGVTLNGGDAAIAQSQRRILASHWTDLDLTTADMHPVASHRYFPDDTFVPWYYDLLVGRPLSSRVVKRVARHLPRVKPLMIRRALRAGEALASGRRWGWVLTLTVGQRRRLRTMLEADLVVYCGGTSLTENYDLAPKLFDIELARAMGKPYVYMQQSAGPFRDPSVRERLKEQFSASTLVILRDQRSLEHVLDLGVPAEKCLVLPDTVFALASGHLQEAEPAGPPTRVAVSVREWKFFSGMDPETGMRNYFDSLRSLVIGLVRDHGCEVVFVSTCQGRPEYWTDDSATAAQVAAALPDDVSARVTVDRRARTAEELIDFLAEFHVLVATRLHAAILGTCAGLPTLAIAYEYKSQEVWRQLGLPDLVMDIEDVSPAGLLEAVETLLAKRESVRAVLRERVPLLRAGALSAAAAIDDALEQRLAGTGDRR